MVNLGILGSTILIKLSLSKKGGGWGKHSQSATAVVALWFMKKFTVKPNTLGCGDVFIVGSILTK